MTSLRFGPLDARHRARLAEILTATAVFSPDEIDVALELFDETVEARASGYEFVGVFDAVGRVLGYACYGMTPGTDGTFDLYWIAVHPDAQGSGVGRRLIEEVESRLCAGGGRLLVVETSSREAYALTRRFYEAGGYGEAARIADFYGPADDRLILTKRLTRAVATAAAAHSPPPH
jgi:ribosomal protein S18 acetylase RimI-like enzyme